MVVYSYNLSTWEAETEGLEVQSRLQLHHKLETSQGYMSLCLKK